MIPMVITEVTLSTQRSSDDFSAAFHAWNSNLAYLDNGGNYRLRPEPATPTHRPRGKIAPWNQTVKRAFPSSAEFHAAVKASIGQDAQGRVLNSTP